MIILSIETSCDETAVAIVEFKKDEVKVLANIVSSQIKTHSKFGGVVPSLASRMHLKNMVPVLNRAFKFAKIKKQKIDYIAVTNGPGLIPALIIGVSAAKTLAYFLNKPLIGVNHLEGHIYTNWLRPVDKNIPLRKVKRQSNFKTTHEGFDGGIATSFCGVSRNDNIQTSLPNFKLWKPEFPVLCLIVSGGHTQLVLMKKDLNYKIIGETVDDAVGEAFDKVARLLGFDYPGGPVIEKRAKSGDKNKFKFPRPMINSNDFNFSFSGLKTAVLYEVRSDAILNLSKNDTVSQVQCDNRNIIIKRQNEWREKKYDVTITNYQLQYQADIAASFQQAVIDVLISKTIKVAKKYQAKNVLIGGGVSTNRELQMQFKKDINKEIPKTNYQFPNVNLSTDNALMIAVVAYKHIEKKKGIENWKSIKADANLRL